MRPLALALLATIAAVEDGFRTVAARLTSVRVEGEALLDLLPTEGDGGHAYAEPVVPQLHETAAEFVARGGTPGDIGADYIYVGWAAPGSVLPDPEEGEAYGDFLARGGLLVEGPNGEHLPASHVFDGTNWIPAAA